MCEFIFTSIAADEHNNTIVTLSKPLTVDIAAGKQVGTSTMKYVVAVKIWTIRDIHAVHICPYTKKTHKQIEIEIEGE